MRSTLSISYLILRRRVSAVSKDAPQARTILRPRLIDRAQHPEAVPLGVQLEVAVGHRVGPGRRAPEAAQRVDVDAGDAAVRVVGLVAGEVEQQPVGRVHRHQLGDVARLAGQEAHGGADARSEEHTSELQSLMRNSYAVFCWKKKPKKQNYMTK